MSENPAIVYLGLLSAAVREGGRAPEDVVDILSLMAWAEECDRPTPPPTAHSTDTRPSRPSPR